MFKNDTENGKLFARIRLLTVVYVGLLAGLILVADWRGTDYLLAFVGAIPHGDKIGHFLLMGLLSLLVNLSLRARLVSIFGAKLLLGSLSVGAIVVLEEASQIFISSRSFDWLDLVFDFAGIFVFGEAARIGCRKRLGGNFRGEQP